MTDKHEERAIQLVTNWSRSRPYVEIVQGIAQALRDVEREVRVATLKSVERILPFQNGPCECSADLVYHIFHLSALAEKGEK